MQEPPDLGRKGAYWDICDISGKFQNIGNGKEDEEGTEMKFLLLIHPLNPSSYEVWGTKSAKMLLTAAAMQSLHYTDDIDIECW